MKGNPMHYHLYIDKDDRNWRRRIEQFKSEMERLHTCTFTEEEFDASDIVWDDRRERKYASDEYVFTKTQPVYDAQNTNVDAVLFFVSEKHWRQGRYRLKGFKLGRVFNGYYVGFVRMKYAKDTGEHEVLHLVDEFIKTNAGVSLEQVFKVDDFDSDIVHSQKYWKDLDYKYDEVWGKLSDHLSNAVFQRRQGTLQNKIAQLQLLVKLYMQLLGLMKYKSNSIYEVEIKQMHTTKRHNAPLRAENAVIGHIDLGTEQGTINEILNGTRSASYHWYIPRHAKYVIEFVPKEYAAWHAGRLSNPEYGLEGLLGGPNEQIESGEPNWYAFGICYEGIDSTTPPTDAQIDLGAQLMRMKKIHELPIIGHYQVTDYKPLIVEQFVNGLYEKINL
jgi:hypothetical protein